ncbi:unnamed protein product [Lymnaea stagnalis]|uniref:C2H2-type domain-containing protein n=1 Tax=Lymnaea stagnalis TaxID=6523 RepID=A0AAV2I4A0_LYMST
MSSVFSSTSKKDSEQPAQNRFTLLDVESFKRRMNPKKSCLGTRSKQRPQKRNEIKSEKAVEHFKSKFRPNSYNNQENEPIEKVSRNCVASSKSSQREVLKTASSHGRRGKHKPAQRSKFLCEVCCAMFKTSTNLKEHIKIHSEEKEFRCVHCNYGCHRERNLKLHMLTHADQKPIKCQLCDYSCIQNFQLRAHLLLHESATPFQCQQCDAKFKKQAGLKMHLLTHSNQFKFKCDHCQYVTNRFADYRRHLLIHTKSKPEKCPYCSYSCIRKSRLRAHMLVHRGKNVNQGEDSELTKLEKDLMRCDKCEYVCTTTSRLRKHQKSHVKKKELNFIEPQTSVLKDECKYEEENPLILTFAPLDKPSVVLTTSHCERPPPNIDLISLTTNQENQLSDFNSSLSQELLTTAENEQISYSHPHDEQELLNPANQAILLTASDQQQEGQQLIQNDQTVLLSTTGQQWDPESEWPDTDTFTVGDLGSFTFDQLLQPSNNFIVTVVKEEPLPTVVKEEPVEPEIMRNHSKSKMYHCTHCLFSCDYKSTFNKHLRKHTSTKNYKCAHCHYMCDELFRMKKHLISHTDQKLYHCDVCQFACKSKMTLQQHALTHTTGGKPSNLYQCPRCDHRCKSLQGLKSHLVKHTGDNPYKCDICSEKFATDYLMKKHKFSHGLKPFQCQYCSYSCVQKQQLSIHLLQHTYEYPFCCHLCNAKYKKHDSLKIHMMSLHENRHKYNCELCNYAGNRAADFREHMLTHSDRKPHQCPECSFSFIRPTQLKKHMAIHMKDQIKPKSLLRKKVYRCAFCDFTCTRTIRLKAHLSKLHLSLPDNVIFTLEREEILDQ